MTTTASRRITAIVAGALLSAGIVAGGMAADVSATHTRNLADYGAGISADNSEAHSAEGGVRHMGDHRDAPGYFERMNGVSE